MKNGIYETIVLLVGNIIFICFYFLFLITRRAEAQKGKNYTVVIRGVVTPIDQLTTIL